MEGDNYLFHTSHSQVAPHHTISVLNDNFHGYYILLAHGMILGRVTSMKTSNMVLAARTTEGCTNPNCKAKKHSTHTTSNCYWPGGGKEGQFPPNFGQRASANATTSTDPPTNPNLSTQANPTTSGQTDHFVLSAQTMNMPGQSGVLINVPSDHPHTVMSHPYFHSRILCSSQSKQ